MLYLLHNCLYSVSICLSLICLLLLFILLCYFGQLKCMDCINVSFLFENDLNIHSKCFNKSELYSFICQAINCLIKVKTLEFDIPEPMCIKGLQMGITLPIIE